VAAEQAQLQIATLLLERGACARPVHAQSGWTPLHFAARDGRPELTAALLEARADGGASEAKGYTPLHLVRNAGSVITLILVLTLTLKMVILTLSLFSRRCLLCDSHPGRSCLSPPLWVLSR
jgi:ankyrin repeat protein